jgi:hypothetical protein
LHTEGRTKSSLINLTAQYTRFGEDGLAGIPMRPDPISVLTALEVPWSERLSIVLEELVNTGPARDLSHPVEFLAGKRSDSMPGEHL